MSMSLSNSLLWIFHGRTFGHGIPSAHVRLEFEAVIVTVLFAACTAHDGHSFQIFIFTSKFGIILWFFIIFLFGRDWIASSSARSVWAASETPMVVRGCKQLGFWRFSLEFIRFWSYFGQVLFALPCPTIAQCPDSQKCRHHHAVFDSNDHGAQLGHVQHLSTQKQ